MRQVRFFYFPFSSEYNGAAWMLSAASRSFFLTGMIASDDAGFMNSFMAARLPAPGMEILDNVAEPDNLME
jgi:hypothetical protein